MKKRESNKLNKPKNIKKAKKQDMDCAKCHIIFCTIEEFQEHKEISKNIDRPEVCSDCNTFSSCTRKGLERHKLMVHKNTKPLVNLAHSEASEPVVNQGPTETLMFIEFQIQNGRTALDHEEQGTYTAHC